MRYVHHTQVSYCPRKNYHAISCLEPVKTETSSQGIFPNNSIELLWIYPM